MSDGRDSPVPPLLSVVVPCFNEARTLENIVEQILKVRLPLEVIIVDDGSTDGSKDMLRSIAEREARVKAIYHDRNRGKGAALAKGFAAAMGCFVIVQDADLEYDPREYYKLLVPALTRDADVVFGSRFKGSDAQRVLYYWHSVANHFLTTLSNMATNLNLTDMETCYKLFRREVIQAIVLKETRFGFEPEITAKVSHMGCRVYETGISYNGRSYEEGKKIGLKDAFRALYCILVYGFLGGSIKKPEQAPLPSPYKEIAERLRALDKSQETSRVFQDVLERHAST